MSFFLSALKDTAQTESSRTSPLMLPSMSTCRHQRLNLLRLRPSGISHAWLPWAFPRRVIGATQRKKTSDYR